MCAAEQAMNSRSSQLPHETEAFYRSYLASALEGIWCLETDMPVSTALPEEEQVALILRCGYIAQSNSAYARMHGVARPEEMCRRRLQDLLARSGSQGAELLRTFVRGGYRLVENELCLETADGTCRWFSLNLTGIVENGSLVRAWGSQRDVTQQYERVAEGWLATFDAIRDAVLVMDLDRRVVLANTATFALFRLPARAVLGRPYHELLLEAGIRVADCPVARALRIKKRTEVEIPWSVRGVWLLGTVDPILDEAGGVTQVVHVLKDITERKVSETAACRQLQFERCISALSARLMQASNDQVNAEVHVALREIREFFELDRTELLEVTADQSALKVVESSPAPSCGQGLAEPMDVAVAFPWVFERVVRRGQCVLASTLDDLPPEAEADRVECLAQGIRSILVIPLSVSASVGYVVVAIATRREHTGLEEYIPRLRLMGDILVNALARQQAEVRARRLWDQLAHVARVAALGELVAALAHELTQPLTAMLSNAQAAQRRLASGHLDPAELEEILADIVSDDLRAGEVIRRVRLSLKKGTWQPQRLDCNRLVIDVARLLRNDALLRQVAISLDLAPTLPSVQGDPIQLQQVLLNLVVNAMDAVEDLPATRRQVRIATRSLPPGRIQVEVCDRGPGIAADNLAGVFAPFYTTKPVGLGMGLAICRSIIQAHEGTIEARNNPDGGATLWFTLPVYEPGQTVQAGVPTLPLPALPSMSPGRP